jgi:hypothetical protein
VARLVCTGRSNREVAAELYVSVKAVEHHLSQPAGSAPAAGPVSQGAVNAALATENAAGSSPLAVPEHRPKATATGSAGERVQGPDPRTAPREPRSLP